MGERMNASRCRTVGTTRAILGELFQEFQKTSTKMEENTGHKTQSIVIIWKMEIH